MKQMKKLILSVFVLTAFFVTSCNDDTEVDGGNDNTTEEKTCRIATIDDNDGSVTEFTYDGDNIVKMKETDSAEVVNYDFSYTSDKLMMITNDSNEKWELTYTGENVTKIEYSADGELEDIYDVSYDADGNPTKIDVSFPGDMGAELYLTYEMTWDNGNMTSMSESEYENGNQLPAITTDYTAYDDKVNYLSRTPLWLIEIDNVFAYSKNNVTAGSVDFLGTPVPLTMTWTYDTDGKAEKAVFSFFGSSTTINFTYDCN